MATYDAPVAEDGQPPSTYTTDEEIQARKRTSIGLSPHRPTARNEVARPPDAGTDWLRWWLVFFLVMLLVAIMLLLAARFLDPATAWPPAWPGVTVKTDAGQTSGTSEYAVALPGYRLWLDESFSQPGATFLPYTAAEHGGSGVLGDQGVYRMKVGPGQLVWTLVDLTAQATYRLETRATVEPALPEGAAGVIGRFAGPGNFYLFTVDGRGAYRVELWRDGQSFTLQSAEASPILFPAGTANRLGVEDDGARLRFYANQALLFEVADPQLPPGRAGLAVRATGEAEAAVDFDWLLIYAPETAE